MGYGLLNHNESVKKASGVCSLAFANDCTPFKIMMHRHPLITHNPQPVTFFFNPHHLQSPKGFNLNNKAAIF
jgi:hypothetical protein